MRELRAYNEAALADIQQRLRVLEDSLLPTALPIVPTSSDSNSAGIERERLEFVKRRLERLERNMYAKEVRVR